MAGTALPAPAGRPLRHGPAVTAPAVLLVLLAVAVAAPGLLTGTDPLAADPVRALEPPGAEHWFGTDHLGRDVLSRVVHGTRHSLSIGVLATALAAGAGLLLGLAAGLAPRWADEALARSFDVPATFPELVLALLVIAVIGPGTGNVILAIGVAQIPTYARVVRVQTFVVRRAGYVEQAVTFGHSRARIVARHVLPNVLGPVPVLAAIGLGQAVIAASGLGFVGMGPQPPAPHPSWRSRTCGSASPPRGWRPYAESPCRSRPASAWPSSGSPAPARG
ncbi:hypothetical protein GCM10010466_57320 [Planomonospora alba]|uniref:ABC transmembrane type-1 domain-containing protein n=1 Tax=Planomonospora alba TaxID=161354 RepID=A0ABP6NUZ7_9ACTN